MSVRVRFTKDFGDHKKGDVVHLRHAEAKQAFKQQAVVVQTDVAPADFETKAETTPVKSNSQETKVSSNGNTQSVRTHNNRRR